MNSVLYQPQQRAGAIAAPRPRVFVIQPPKPLTIEPTEPTEADIAHTPGHRDCPACGRRSLLNSERPLAEMTFPDAFEAWMRARFTQEQQGTSIRYITKSSERTYREYARSLSKFFSETTLNEIHDGHLRTYQEWRGMNYEGRWHRRAAQNRVRKEIGLLIRVMRAARVWNDDLRESFQHLPAKLTDLCRALSVEEQARLLKVMSKRDDWLWIYYYTVLALRTCASTFEMRGLRLKDVDTEHWMIRVGPEASKNKFRNRSIPLSSDDAKEAIRWLMVRARRLGSTEPDHYLFPFGVGSKHEPDPGKPMTKYAMKNSWEWIREKASLPRLRIYDLRHTAITRMAEAGIPISTIMKFAGHVSVKMSEHYTNVSMQATRAAADILAAVHPSMSLEKPLQG